ncbi:MAG: permease prefix domain 1-containing protein, partial [Blastocatellia bacterium]
MRWLRRCYYRCYGVVFKRRIEREIDDELRFHLRMRALTNTAAGLTPREADRNAARSFGRMEIIREYCRDIR